MMGRRTRRLPALLAAALVLGSSMAALSPSASAGTLVVDAPGWQVIAPTGPSTAGLQRVTAAHDITGDHRDDLVVSYSPSMDTSKNGSPFAATNTSWDVFGGAAGALPSTRPAPNGADRQRFAWLPPVQDP